MQVCTHIKSIKQKTPSVKLFTLEYDHQEFRFHPGQWVDIHLTIDDETHNCGYSITSTPSDDKTIEVAVKLAPELKLTEHLHKNSHTGDEVYISNAQGDVFLPDDISGPYVFIAGGVGITPLYSMIQHINSVQPATPVTLIYSITTPEEFLFEEELRELAAGNPNFRIFATVTRAKKHKEKFSGRINSEMLRAMELPASANYYLCGPPQMVDDVVDILKRLQNELGITECNIHYDKWWS
ncbi:ferredoxin--NADP reductase [Kaarinaea lacus]